MSENAVNYEYVSYGDFIKIQSEEKIYKLEYDNGYIHYMTPVYPNHDRVKNRIAFNLMNFLKEGKCDVFTSDVAVVFEKDCLKQEYLPDVMVCCEQNKFDGAKYKGIPSFIVEILSHATEQRDTGVKLKMYEIFGVPEYWVVNIKEKNIIAYSNNINGKYMSINTYTTGMEIPCLSGLSMKVDDIFDAMK